LVENNMASDTAKQLQQTISRLQTERQEHAEAISEIDAIFDQYGISADGRTARRGPGRPRKAGRPPGRPATKRSALEGIADMPARKGRPGRPRRAGGRRKFDTSGPVSILEFVQSAGDEGRSTREINEHWKSEGRSGDAYVAIGKLVKEKKLKRKNMPGERGSRYTAA
jgi:hypothetical protein